LFLFIGTGLKSSLNAPPTGEIGTVPPSRSSLAAAPEIINGPAPVAQETKRFLFPEMAVFI